MKLFLIIPLPSTCMFVLLLGKVHISCVRAHLGSQCEQHHLLASPSLRPHANSLSRTETGWECKNALLSTELWHYKHFLSAHCHYQWMSIPM
ncbi:hypothetical protein V8C37DRAFT_371363 [Trichoderma ceciliae]